MWLQHHEDLGYFAALLTIHPSTLPVRSSPGMPLKLQNLFASFWQLSLHAAAQALALAS